ncbi:helix-turn-helix domain-containing protein [uncultured Chitinophaga sp.]|uniref:helix-turn-helix domain-containing protein n=1 Tax=uncultured Chitinophaga sp. TaxID=339340 RepID=UPI0025FCD02E|nr:AraC family transcriptional regulator [uncultured Chitinophaga sp.]
MNLTKEECRQLHLLREMLANNPTGRHDTKDLIKFTGMGSTKLNNSFRFLFQVSIGEFKAHQAMCYADKLLQSGVRIKEVALRLGYSNTSSFTRAYHRIKGAVPSDCTAQK